MQEILSAVDAELFGVWFLIGAASSCRPDSQWSKQDSQEQRIQVTLL